MPASSHRCGVGHRLWTGHRRNSEIARGRNLDTDTYLVRFHLGNQTTTELRSLFESVWLANNRQRVRAGDGRTADLQAVWACRKP